MNIKYSIRNIAIVAITITSLHTISGCNNNKEKTEESKKDSTASNAGKPGSAIALQPGKKYVYFTTDDGPQPPGTNNCIRIFKEENEKVTFFMVGLHQTFGPSLPRIVDTIRNSYPAMLLANHSMTHGFRNQFSKFYKEENLDSAYADFMQAEQEMNIPVKIIRFPGMNTWVTKTEFKGPQSSLKVAQKLKDSGYSVIGWDIEWNTGKGSAPVQGAQQMADMVFEKFETQRTMAPDALVILAHDRMFAKQQYADSLRRFIQIMKQDPSIVFETIDHYPTVQ